VGLGDVFTEDCQLFNPMLRDEPLVGRKQVVSAIGEMLGDLLSLHQGFMAEIEVLTKSTATGIWSMQDLLLPQPGSTLPFSRLEGYGHYLDVYRLGADRAWRIERQTLSRLHVKISSSQRKVVSEVER
jgi:hypothetical protein